MCLPTGFIGSTENSVPTQDKIFASKRRHPVELL